MRPKDVVPATSVRFLVEGLHGLGHPPAEVAHEIGVDLADLGPDGMLARSACVAMMQLALRLEGPGAGLRLGLAVPVGGLGLVDHLTGAAPTVRAALEDLVRYFALVATEVRLALDASTLTLDLPAWPVPFRRLLAEATFAIVDQRLTTRVGRPFDPLGVAFPWPEPSDADALHRRWSGLSFDADAVRLRCRPEHLDAPLTTTDGSLRALLTRYAHAELRRQPEFTTVRGRVSQYLVEMLPTVSSSGDVARALGMSDRSLRRALAAEKTSFSAVRKDCLQGIAEAALRDPAQTIGEVAWLLGYSEPSAFHRAFRRWTGATPEQFRRGMA